MVNETSCKLYKATGSYSLSLKKSFIEDSACPFEEGDVLNVKMDGDKMVVTKGEEK